jgi:outer membrane receptor protein involved in Fe transport
VRVRTLAVLLTVVLLCAMSSITWSQTVQGVITGTVTDPSGAAVPNATVTITNAGTNASQSATTGSDGTYRFPLVPPGTYTVDIKAANFAEVRASGVVVQASQTVPFDVKLEIAKAQATIEVTEQAALVQTATAELATQVDRTTIENAPLVNRDIFATLPFLAPQVSPGLNMNPTSGGARESGTSYLLNGGDNNDNFSEGGINMHPPLESVQDFSILTNSMSAQYGRGNGAVVSANQKSGTNKFHGAVYEFNRNASLNAGDFFNNSAGLPKPKYIRNQFGGEVDGPIRKDKTFFTFAYDRIDLRSGAPLTGATTPNFYVPTSAALARAKANAGPIAQQILAAFPPLTSDASCSGVAGTGGANTVGCVSLFDPATDKVNTYYGRIDHNFTASDRLSINANIWREANVDKYGGGPLNANGGISGTTNNHFHQISLNESHVFNPRLVNEATIAHNRHYNVFVAGNGQDTVPHIIVDNLSAGCLGYSIGGPFDGNLVQGFTQDRWAVTDNLTWTVGRHSLKFGGGTQSGILYRNWDLGGPGYYEFSELYAPFTPAGDGTLQADGTIANLPPTPSHTNFANDYPYAEETSIDPRTGAKANAYRHYVYHDYYAFAQDDWKITPRLTLNLGLRWDRYGAPGETHNVIAQFTNLGTCSILDRTCIAAARVGPVSSMWNTQNHDFGPRVGFAWDPLGNGKMAVRGGYGIYYDRIFDNIWSNGAWNPPFYALIDFNASCGDAIFYSNPTSIGAAYNPNGPNGPIPYPGKRVSVRTMDVHMKDSSSQNFNLSVERQVLGGLLLRAGYQGSLGRHLPMLENLNRTDGQAYNAKFSNLRPNPLYTGFNYRSDSVSSSYNALVLEAQKRMGHGLEFQTGYTYSKLLDLNSELFAGCSTIGSFTAPYYYVSNAQQNMYRGPAAFDHRHAYKFNVIYQLPFMKQEKGFVGHAVGGWTVAAFYQMYSGHPIDVYNGRARFRGNAVDANGIRENIGGDYNLDGVANDHPVFTGSSVSSVYSGGSPADGIFTDNNQIGCGFPGQLSTNTAACNTTFGVTTPSTLFANPAYPTSGPLFERFGTLGRGVFHGPRFQELDMSLGKSFRLTETTKVEFRAQAQNVLNHPSFDCTESNLNSSSFGKSQCLAQSIQGLGAPTSRVMSLGLRVAF